MNSAVPILTILFAAMTAPVAGCGGSDVATDRPAGTTGGTNQRASLQQQYVNLVKKVSPSVVQIRTAEALGSGVVFDDRGDVVTNAHVVDGARRVVVTLASGESHAGTVVGRDVGDALAVFPPAAGRPPAATFADSSQLQVG